MSLVLAGTGAPWADGQPQDPSHGTNLPEVFPVALDLLQNSRGAQFPASDLAHHCHCSVNRKGKKKKKIDVEERFYLFDKEAEEEGYLELP